MMEDILSAYDQKIETLDNFKSSIESLLDKLLKSYNIKVHSISSRTKDRISLETKITKKNKYTSLSEITDIVGLRIITHFEEEVDSVSDLISKEFIVDKENSLDKRVKDYDRFGYSSVHFVVSLIKGRSKLTEYSDFKNLKCEIQVRSILQHAWAEIEHDIGYKCKESIPDVAKRNFSRVAALLETADLEFTRLKKSLLNYSDTVSQSIKENPADVELNAISVKTFASESSLIKEIDNEIAIANNSIVANNYDFIDTRIQMLKYLGVNSIKDLENALIEHKGEIVKFSNVFLDRYKDNSRGQFSGGVCLLYLCYVLITQSESDIKIEEFSIRFFNSNQHHFHLLKSTYEALK